MLDPAIAEHLRASLVSIGGGYLRNPVRQPGVTCADCATPTDGYHLCRRCKDNRISGGLGDAAAFLTYAIAGQKSGYVMRGYKARPMVVEHRMVVGLLLMLAQSAALALRGVGADKVSVLVVARWLKTDFAENQEFIRQLAERDYDPGICPWTGRSCP